jgi:cytochrome c oxidase subunit 2
MTPPLVARCIAAAIGATAGGYLAAAVVPDPHARVELTARKYDFSATEIPLRKGVPVTFAITTPDFVHGFAVPDLNVRADLVPGKTVQVTFTPREAGRYVFLCDNFCGEAHERMTGFLVVTD